MELSGSRIDRTFVRLRQAGELGLFPYLMAGYPDLPTCSELLDVVASSGADGIELGVAFSDPLADGVTMQRVNAQALATGAGVVDALALVRELRRRHQLPIVLMSYLNPLLAYGLERLCRDAAEAGVDGFIVPDLPLEEAASFQEACGAAGLHYVFLVAPTTGVERLEQVGRYASGFVYCVALVGVTGARSALASDLPEFLSATRCGIDLPLVAGFGISTPAHIAALVNQADGAIVASAIADLIERTDPGEIGAVVGAFVRELKAATKQVAGV